MSTTPYEPSFPPSRQDYRELIDHHYVIRGLTFAPLILFPIAMKTGAQYGPLSLWTGIGMNLSILLTCLTIPLAIPVMLRDAREAQARQGDPPPTPLESRRTSRHRHLFRDTEHRAHRPPHPRPGKRAQTRDRHQLHE